MQREKCIAVYTPSSVCSTGVYSGQRKLVMYDAAVVMQREFEHHTTYILIHTYIRTTTTEGQVDLRKLVILYST